MRITKLLVLVYSCSLSSFARCFVPGLSRSLSFADGNHHKHLMQNGEYLTADLHYHVTNCHLTLQNNSSRATMCWRLER